MALPDFLNNFDVDDYELLKIEQIFVGELGQDGKISYVSIFGTPHYEFASAIYAGSTGKLQFARGRYLEYLKIQETAHSPLKFEQLCSSMRRDGYDWRVYPILVFTDLRRPFPLFRRDVADGFHRLAALAALGYENINVLRLKRKDNIFQRLVNRVRINES